MNTNNQYYQQQIHSPNNIISQPQETVVMTRYSFFYKAYNDFQIYHITCEETPFEIVSLVSYTFIIRMLNKINYDIDLSLNEQQQEVFSEEHKVNLEFHLKHDLANYLAPIDTSQQPMTDNDIINQSLDSTQDHINTNI
ncbi:hypothetical protein C1645_816459 [Glomus cerebriforme]|uniref:Uncharacterized protein n=1 Tax=Glomus cerebriforme TaxID=658196 RepID=A0A397TBK1_9GLOM|nr:hypothetical protein C1645_816459 [Glomus cerebriforme]